MGKITLLMIICIMLSGCAGIKAPATQPAATEPPTEVTTEASTQPATEPATAPELPAFADCYMPVLPDGSILLEQELGGLTSEQALLLTDTILDRYTLQLKVNKDTLVLTGEQMGLCCDPDSFLLWADALIRGDTPDNLPQWQICKDTTQTLIRKILETPARNVMVEYKQQAEQFGTVSAQVGTGIKIQPILDAIYEAVKDLSPTASANTTSYVLLPKIANDTALLPEATRLANEYLSLDIRYTYEIPGGKTVTEAVSKEALASFVTIDESFSVSLSPEAVRGYVAAMAGKYGGEAENKDFITTSGAPVNRTTQYYSSVIHQQVMYDHLLGCLQSHTDGALTVPYIPYTGTRPYGGNYVEISLTDQQLWIYQNDLIAVSVPMVSGDVASHDYTGGGVFQVEDKDTTCYLVGYDFRDYVEYWIGFNGKIGIHDASWRTDFGNRIYLYDGSHGCVNIPLDMARSVYDALALDSFVIVYGGKTATEPLSQALYGAESYQLDLSHAPFKLDVTAVHPGTELTYTSSDPRVVNISPSGIVTVISPGTAEITVISHSKGCLEEASFTAQITVAE